MSHLNWKQNSFVERMGESSEHAQWGFELLLKRDDLMTFFDALQSNGLFDPVNNPAPISVEDGKYVRIPYWPALDYLLACASAADSAGDLALADKVMNVVRSVTAATVANAGEPDNYHTNRKFAEILGRVPTPVIQQSDVELVPVWLKSRFDRGMVCHELDKGAMRRLLHADVPDDWSKACRIAFHCMSFTWVDEAGFSETRRKAVSIVDDFWLKQFVDHHVAVLGQKCRLQAAEAFRSQLSDLYSEDLHARASYLFRPAIEEHAQNHDWGGIDNRLVEALRDSLIAWIDTEPTSATPYVDTLLVDSTEIVRRIAIHLLNVRWTVLRSLYRKHVGSVFFQHSHLHELHVLLRDRFVSFDQDERAATLDAIRNIRASEGWSEPDRVLKLVQRNWLSAIAGNGFVPADNWFEELIADPQVGPPGEHPEFLSYSETWHGFGPTPIRPEELVEFVKDGSAVQRLNSFQPDDTWRGPSKRALVDALEEAVLQDPEAFLTGLPAFSKATRPYQFGLLNGFKRLWESSKGDNVEAIWERLWPALVGFFEELLNNDHFWTEPVEDDRDLTPTRDWIPPLISEFLRAGTRNDSHAYGAELLPRTWSLIQTLLQRSEAVMTPRDDAMTQAINAAKGKAIEALLSHALRVCRIADASNAGGHHEQWKSMEGVFDGELAKCRNANFEFSTLMAAYLANLEYLSSEWLRAKISLIFPLEFPANLTCAVNGLAHAPATRSIYQLLVMSNVLDSVMRMPISNDGSRTHLMERIALAYLWGDEELDSSRLAPIFAFDHLEDLQTICSFYWSVSNQDVAPPQVARIIDFWRRTIVWMRTLPEIPRSLASNLSRLSVYVSEAEDEKLELLEYVAPYVGESHNENEFIEQLLRLLPLAPARISSILRKVLDAQRLDFDYRDNLKDLIRGIAAHGFKADAIEYASRLLHLPEMFDLYKGLSQSGSS